jgi:nucleoside 2-deoxyribosyltransferase
MMTHMVNEPKLVYYAGPLFSVAERCFNEHLTAKIRASGYQVFLPQRDGVDRTCPPYDTMTAEERRAALFRLDTETILACDVFVMILDGRVPDEGACVELGLAYGRKTVHQPHKRLIGLQTDVRAAFLGAKLNPMVRMALDQLVETEDALLSTLAALTGSPQRHYQSGS